MHRYRLHLLGEPALRDPADPAGAAISLWRPMVALLALLVRDPARAVRRDQAAALLWPDSDDARGRRALRQLLFRLRRVASLVEADPVRIRLAADRVGVDVLDFESAVGTGQLEPAAALYEGAFLDGFTLPGSPDFDQWADGEREGLRRSAVSVLERLTRQAVAAGRWEAAGGAAARWTDLEPYSEDAVTQAMAIAAQRGDRVGALVSYESFRQRLAHEIGARPGADLERLAERVRASPPPAAPGPAGTDGGAQPGGRLELPLVGREEDFLRLTGCWAAARSGRSRLVLLRGEPGIGKSRLAEEFRRWVAMTDATTLICPAYEVEAGVPYATLAGGLREALHAPGIGGVDARTVAELSRIVPDYATRFPGADVRTDGALEAGHLRILEAWRDLVESLIHEAPLLLVLDDLPWADDASLAALHYAWRTLGDRRLMLLATARGTGQDELAGAAALVTAAMRDDPDACTSLVLQPLDRSAIAAASPGDVDPERLERRSGGNPLFLVELLRAVADDGAGDAPPTEAIRLVTLDRVRRLEPDTLGLLHAAAVLGRQFPLPHAAAIAELTPREAADAVDTLLDRGLVRQVGYGYDFVHDVVRDVVRESMGAARRAALHGLAFAALRPGDDQDASGLGPERVGALAHHAAAAGLIGEAHGWHLRAARSAIALYAPAEASRALRSALEFAGSAAERREVWEAIAELARVRSDFRGAAVAYQSALEAADEPADRLRLRLRILHMAQRAGLLQRQDVEDLAAGLRPEAEAAGGAALGQLRFVLGEADARAGSFGPAVDHAVAAAASFREAGEAGWLVRALLLQAGAAARTDGGDALAALDEAEQVAVEHGLEPELRDVRIEKATELSRRGRWDEAIAGFADIRALGPAAGDWSNSAIACVNMADLQARRGEWDLALDALDEAERLAERFGFPHVTVVARLNRALLEWLRGDRGAAADAARDAHDAAAETGVDAPAMAAAAIQALIRLESGQVAEARAFLAASPSGGPSAVHPSWSDDTELIVAARTRFMAATGDRGGAIALVRSARQAAREPYGYALLTLEQARLEREGAPATAGSLAAEALVILSALGATPLAEDARRLAAGSPRAPAT